MQKDRFKSLTKSGYLSVLSNGEMITPGITCVVPDRLRVQGVREEPGGEGGGVVDGPHTAKQAAGGRQLRQAGNVEHDQPEKRRLQQHGIEARLVLGSWVKPCGTQPGIREEEKAPYALPNILVLTCSSTGLRLV